VWGSVEVWVDVDASVAVEGRVGVSMGERVKVGGMVSEVVGDGMGGVGTTDAAGEGALWQAVSRPSVRRKKSSVRRARSGKGRYLLGDS